MKNRFHLKKQQIQEDFEIPKSILHQENTRRKENQKANLQSDKERQIIENDIEIANF